MSKIFKFSLLLLTAVIISSVKCMDPGNCFVSGSREEGTVKIWNIGDPRRELEPIKVFTHRQVCSIKFNPANPNILASYSFGEGTVNIWDIDDPRHESEPIKTFTHRLVHLMKFSPANPNILITCSAKNDGIIKVWDTSAPGKEPVLVKTLAHDRANVIEFNSEKPNILATCSNLEGTIKIWDINAPGEEPAPVKILAHENVNSVEFNPENPNILVSWAPGLKTLKTWDWSTDILGQELINTSRHTRTCHPSVTPSTSELSAILYRAREIKVWDIGRESRLVKIFSHRGVTRATFSPTRLNIFASAACEEGTINVWDIDALDEDPIKTFNHRSVSSIVFPPAPPAKSIDEDERVGFIKEMVSDSSAKDTMTEIGFRRETTRSKNSVVEGLETERAIFRVPKSFLL